MFSTQVKQNCVILGDGAAAKLTAILMREYFPRVTIIGSNLFNEKIRVRAQHAHSFSAKGIENFRKLSPAFKKIFDQLDTFDVSENTKLKFRFCYLKQRKSHMLTVGGGYYSLMRAINRSLSSGLINCIDNARVKEVLENNRVVFSQLEKDQSIEGDLVIVATGRYGVKGVRFESIQKKEKYNAWYASTLIHITKPLFQWYVCAHDMKSHNGSGVLLVNNPSGNEVCVSAVNMLKHDLPRNYKELSAYLESKGFCTLADYLNLSPDKPLHIWRSNGVHYKVGISSHNRVIAIGDSCLETPPYRGFGFLHLSMQLQNLKECLSRKESVQVTALYWALHRDMITSIVNTPKMGFFSKAFRKCKSIFIIFLATIGYQPAIERIFEVIHGYIDRSSFPDWRVSKIFMREKAHVRDKKEESIKDSRVIESIKKEAFHYTPNVRITSQNQVGWH